LAITTPTVTTTNTGTTTPTVPAVVSNGIGANFDVAGVRRADEVGNVIININAPSVIDEQGFSRAVIDALNNSERRSGGGSSQFIQ
jgi:hypothetical protein